MPAFPRKRVRPERACPAELRRVVTFPRKRAESARKVGAWKPRISTSGAAIATFSEASAFPSVPVSACRSPGRTVPAKPVYSGRLTG
jgi:hypothetical protein